MTPMRALYVDMNSFFASVEQQLDPALRGRPVGVTATETMSGVCVAASSEAKAAGVRTGTHVRDAIRLCPGIVFRPSRHRLYARVNRKIADVIDSVAELEAVRSIDEFQVALGGTTSELAAALELGRTIKAAVRDRVGSRLLCSIGIGPNHLLAKIAGKLRKPDGLDWLAPENMPERIAHLDLDDLPGISRAMKARLTNAGVRSVVDLHGLDPRHARAIWRSVEGDRFVRALQGMELPLSPTRRNGYGSSKVLAPRYRSPASARHVSRWLVEKAAERMRRDGWCARRFALSVRFTGGRRWSRHHTCGASQDTRFLLAILESLWGRVPVGSADRVLWTGVHLGDLVALDDRPGDMLMPLEPGRESVGERLACAVDRLNARYGRRVVTFGVHQEHPGFFERG